MSPNVACTQSNTRTKVKLAPEPPAAIEKDHFTPARNYWPPSSANILDHLTSVQFFPVGDLGSSAGVPFSF